MDVINYRVIAVLSLAAAFAGCSGHNGGAGQASPAADASSLPGSAASASPSAVPSGTPVAINVHAGRVGARLVGITVKQRGVTRYVIEADSNESHQVGPGRFLSRFEQPNITFFDSSGKAMTGDAPVADADTGSKQVTMTGGVHARTSDDTTLSCDQMVYDDAHRKIKGTGNVILTTKTGDTLRGDVIDADVRLEHVRIGHLPQP
jgi:LPS export ABC transporter protein LptC